MPLFAILSPHPQNPKLERELERLFQGDDISLATGQWIVSTSFSARELADGLGISVDHPRVESAIVATFGAYYGRAPKDVWDWMQIRMEREIHGPR